MIRRRSVEAIDYGLAKNRIRAIVKALRGVKPDLNSFEGIAKHPDMDPKLRKALQNTTIPYWDFKDAVEEIEKVLKRLS